MTAFKYKALTNDGQPVTGILEADNEKHLRQQLSQREQWLLESAVSSPAQHQIRLTGTSLNSGDLVLLTQQLAVLLDAGVPVVEALGIVAVQSEKPAVEWLLRDIKSHVSEGQSLEAALSKHNKTFLPLYTALVAAGEKTGNLSTILQQLADYTARRHSIRLSLIKALIYPGILAFTAIAIIIVLMTTVFPRIVSQFDYLQSALPRPTQILMGISDFLHQYGFWVLLVLVGLGGLWRLLLRHQGIRLYWHRRQLRFILIGKLLNQLNAARFADTLAICAYSGLPLLDGIKVATRTTNNDAIQKQLVTVAERVHSGQSLFSALETAPFIDPMMRYMMGSGEKSGRLPDMLQKAAQYQQTALESRIDLAVKLFTPLMMLVLAGLVFFIILATLLPILALNNLV